MLILKPLHLKNSFTVGFIICEYDDVLFDILSLRALLYYNSFIQYIIKKVNVHFHVTNIVYVCK